MTNLPGKTPKKSSRRAYVILNPVAGNSRPQDVRRALEENLAAEAYEIYETTGQENLSDIVTTAIERGYDFFIAAGGDGTVSGVADGLTGTNIPLGILPVGTGNTLARDLGIPLKLTEAVKLLNQDHITRSIDAIQVESQIYLLNVSVGVSSFTIRGTDRERKLKRLLGKPAYLWAGLKYLIGFQPKTFRLEVDGKPIMVRAKEIVITNARILGVEFFHWGPHIRLDDGHLDIIVVQARNLLDYVIAIWNLLWGRHRQNPKARYLSVDQRVSINTDGSLPVQGDGEFIGHPPVEINVVPAAVRIVAPSDDQGDAVDDLNDR